MRFIALATAVLIVSGTFSFAQTESPASAADLRDEVSYLQKMIKAEKEKINEITGKLLATDQQIEERVDKIVNYLASVQDSVDSGTKVLNIKTKAMEGLGKAAQKYIRERDKLQDSLRRSRDSDVTEEQTKSVKALNKRAEKRIDQIVNLTKTLATDADFQRYTRDFSTGWQRSETKGYKWNKRTQMAAKPTVNKVDKALEQSVEHLERQNLTLQAQKQSQRKADQAKYDEQIERNEEIIQTRKEQLAEVQNGPEYGQGGKSLSKQQAQKLDQKLKEVASQINTDFNELMRLNSELQVERMRLHNLRKAKKARINALERIEEESNP